MSRCIKFRYHKSDFRSVFTTVIESSLIGIDLVNFLHNSDAFFESFENLDVMNYCLVSLRFLRSLSHFCAG